MATSNFIKQKYFNLYVNKFKYEYEDDAYCFDECLFDETRDFLDEYNTENLQFFDIDLRAGYYGGYQTFIQDARKYYSDSIDIFDFLEDYNSYDGSYIYKYYGYNKHILKLKILKEIKYINDTILPQLVDCYNFTQLKVVGTFSNGETIYERV